MAKFMMNLIFKKSSNMELVLDEIKAICEKTNNELLSIKNNDIVYGSDSYSSFAPAYVHLRYSPLIKDTLLEAYWIDAFGKESCKKTILEAVG